jgi:hypothetical protein
MILILENVCFMCGSGILNWVCRCFIEGIWVVARAPVVRTIKGMTFQPCECMRLRSGWYLVSFKAMVSGENLSLQKANSINWMSKVGSGWVGEELLYESRRTQRRSGLSLARQRHLKGRHEQDKS